MSKSKGHILQVGISWGRRTLLLASLAGLATSIAFAQEAKNSNSKASVPQESDLSQQESTYVRPNFRQRFHNYKVRTFGPLRMTTLVFASAISHADNVPPEWGQGWGAYCKRLASDLGSSTVGGTTNFALSEALHLDTKYYPCECKGIWPRVRHALISSVTARAGDDGHRVFSVPAVAAPYAGAFSTLIWYPARYGSKDAFRTGNYDLLDGVGMKVALEFLDPLFKKLHHQN